MRIYIYLTTLLVLAFVKVSSINAQEEFSGNMLIITHDVPFDTVIKRSAHVKPSPRQITWQEYEMTAFVHFGLNTFYGKEWGEKDYLASVFNPSMLDARQWAKTAKEAGAKLLIVVAKHHDGFCLWPSAFTDFSVKNSPWKNGNGDVVAEVAAACREYGIKLGVYLSPWDINSPVYGTDEYNEYFKNQLRELLTNYRDIYEVWFDGACGEGPNGKRQIYDWNGYYKLIRELAPQAVIAVMGPDVRWVGTESGYGRETEWSVVPISASLTDAIASASQKQSTGGVFVPPDDMYQPDLGSRDKIKNAKGLIWFPSEVDVSVRPGWFYHENEDSLVKTPEKLVDIYNSSVGRNSSLLLNFSPDKRGLIHDNDIRNVREMRRILDKTFEKNIATDARIKVLSESGNFEIKTIVDADNTSFWTPGPGKNTAELLFKFKKEVEFNRILLQENYRNGQRVEAFELEAFLNGQWKKIATGTTIGYKRILVLNDIKAKKVKLKILSSRDYPEISTVGLYKAPQNVHD